MKKLLLFLLIISISLMSVSAKSFSHSEDTSVPYKTYTTGPSQSLILTQTAYQPAGYLPLSSPLSLPEDMVFYNDQLYVLNTGSKSIIVYNDLGEETSIISIDFLVTPTGIDVYDDVIYIADKGLREVLTFTLEGDLINRFGRPTEPIFGQSSLYIPTKIEVGPRGNMYVIGEGSTSGIIQLSNRGEFLGFFATNLTGQSWFQTLADLLGVQYALNTPSSATNLKMDLEGSLYTISPTDSKPLKRFNIASEDTLQVDLSVENLNAVAISDIGNIVTLSSSGVITEYDAYGRLIFSFGGIDTSGQKRLGLLLLPVDIELASDGTIFVLDKGLEEVLIYTPTAFTHAIHTGLESFNNGIYDIDVWQHVLSQNEMFALANQAIGQANYRESRYDEALHYFALAEYSEGYSNAFWQIRYSFLQTYLGWIMLGFLLLFISNKLLHRLDQSFGIYNPVRTFQKRLIAIPLLAQLSMLWKMLAHPIDVFYDIKHRHRATYLSATTIYVIFILMTIIATILPSFLFRTVAIENFSLLRHVGLYGGLLVLLVFSNYLIATLHDGEGWFKDVYIGFAYSLAPYIFLTIPIVISSYGFTLFESFIYQFMWVVAQGWTILYFLIMLKEIHGYSIKQIVFNLFLTSITMILIILLLFVSYLLLSQVFDYFVSLIREVSLRV